MSASPLEMLSEHLALPGPHRRYRYAPNQPSNNSIHSDRDLTLGDLDLIHLLEHTCDRAHRWFLFRDGQPDAPLQIGKIKHMVWGGGSTWTIRFYYQALRPTSIDPWQCLWRQDFSRPQWADQTHQLLGDGLPLDTPANLERIALPAVVSRSMGSHHFRTDKVLASTFQLHFHYAGHDLRLVEPLPTRDDGQVWQYLSVCQVAADCDLNRHNEQAPFLWEVNTADLDTLKVA